MKPKDTAPHALLLPVQYLRGAAAVAVFLYHISTLTTATWGPKAAGVDHVGAAGVDLFFVISGFIMAMILARPDPFSVRGFMRHRIARVVPGYYVATFGVMLLAILFPAALTTSADVMKLLRSLLFFPMADNQGSLAPILLVGWTLNYEIFFYFLVALMAGLFSDRGLVKTACLLVSLAVVGAIVAPRNPTLGFYTDPILIEFALGILVYHLHSRMDLERHRLVSTLLFLGGIGLLLLQMERDPGTWRVVLWGLPSSMILLGSLRAVRFDSPSLRVLGDWSYSFYLTHLFVLGGYIRFVLPSMPPMEIPFFYHYMAMTILGLSAAALFYRLVEVPSMRLLLRRAGRPGHNSPSRPSPVA